MSTEDELYQQEKYTGILERAKVLDSHSIDKLVVKSTEDKRGKVIDIKLKPGKRLDLQAVPKDYEVEQDEKDGYIELIVSKNYKFHIHNN